MVRNRDKPKKVYYNIIINVAGFDASIDVGDIPSRPERVLDAVKGLQRIGYNPKVRMTDYHGIKKSLQTGLIFIAELEKIVKENEQESLIA